MAREEYVVSVSERLHPWNLVYDVAAATEDHSWVLVGGLMVHAIAIRSQVTPPRPTGDIDLLVNVAAAHMADVAGPLQALGFSPVEPTGAGPFHRFARADDVVDVMLSSEAPRTRWRRRDVLRAPGAVQALKRQDTYILEGIEQTVRIHVPDALAAIILKAAAHTVDPRDADRHLEDIVVLLACAAGPAELDLDRLTKNDRTYLRKTWPLLADPRGGAWTIVEPEDAILARRAYDAVAERIAD